MDTKKLSGILTKFEELTKNPEKYLNLQEKEANQIKLLTKNLYSYTKKSEKFKQKNTETLRELVIAGLDEEQIWQQIELQNNVVCNPLVNDIAQALAKKNKLKFPLKQNKKKPKANRCEEENSDCEGNEDKEIETEIKKESKQKGKQAKSSIVDDKFFKLHEMEKFLEKVEKGEDDDSDGEIDYFEEESANSNDESENQFHYSDFFDQPDDENNFNRKKRKSLDSDVEDKKIKFSLNDISSEEEEDENMDSENEFSDVNDEHVGDNFDDDENDSNDENHYSKDEEDVKKVSVTQPSTFEARQERIKSRINVLEKEALKEKPWQLKGEVTAQGRPQNSLLQEYVEFDIASRPTPVLTEKSTLKLEDIIIQRIKDKAWDDVVRKIKPVENDTEYKKRLVLDQEKSKLSLAQIYEKEYLKQLDSKNEDLIDKPEVIPPEHQEITSMMNKLFSKLDALCNFHFTPKQVEPEVKIISNVPAIAMEEVAPIAISDATLLAPEEVKAKGKGDLIGKSERTTTDKKRERRKKKIKQKLKFKKLEAKAKLQVQDVNSKNIRNKKLPQKLLEKITKSTSITQLKEGSGKHIKSSNAFFSKLQDETQSKVKKPGFEMKSQKLGKKKLKQSKIR